MNFKHENNFKISPSREKFDCINHSFVVGLAVCPHEASHINEIKFSELSLWKLFAVPAICDHMLGVNGTWKYWNQGTQKETRLYWDSLRPMLCLRVACDAESNVLKF